VVALHGGKVRDRDGGHRVVIENCTLALAVADGAARRAGEVDEEGLVGLVLGVAIDQDGEGLARLAGGEGDGARNGLVVGVRRRGGSVGGAVIYGGGRRTDAGHGDGERKRRRPGGALGRRHIIHRQKQRLLLCNCTPALGTRPGPPRR